MHKYMKSSCCGAEIKLEVDGASKFANHFYTKCTKCGLVCLIENIPDMPKTNIETVEVVSHYSKEGFLIKMTANDIPIFIPKQDFPSVVIFPPLNECEWFMEKKFMTLEEFNNFKKFYDKH